MILRLLLLIFLVMQSLPGIAQTLPPVAVEFFVVSETPVPGGKFIDTPKLPRVGYFSADPSLRITRLLGLSRGKSSSYLMGADHKFKTSVTPSLILSFTEDDATKIAELTAKSVGMRILIQIAGSPILAPTLAAPITDGSIEVSFKGEELKSRGELLTPFVRRH